MDRKGTDKGGYLAWVVDMMDMMDMMNMLDWTMTELCLCDE